MLQYITSAFCCSMALSHHLTKCFSLLFFFSVRVTSLDNGLALTPPMGFSTWSIFRSNINDTLIRELADGLVESGLAKAGDDLHCIHQFELKLSFDINY